MEIVWLTGETFFADVGLHAVPAVRRQQGEYSEDGEQGLVVQVRVPRTGMGLDQVVDLVEEQMEAATGALVAAVREARARAA